MKKFCLCLAPTALVAAIAAGIFAFAVFPSIIEKKVEKEIVIKNGTDAWDRFVDFPIALKWKIYFFNIKNWQNFDGDASKLEYEEKGPYVYDEYWMKDVSAVSSDGESLNYTLRRMYTFNPKLSGDNIASLDEVSVINPALTTGFKGLVTELAATDKVDALAFSGTKTLIIPISLFTYQGVEVRENRRDMYMAKEEVLQISTGKNDAKKVLQVLGFSDGHVNVWEDLNGTTCNVPRGTDGTQFHPDMKPDDVLWAYEPLICRSLSFHNKMSNVEVRGIQTLRFVADDENFQVEGNECYQYKDDPKPPLNDMLPLKKCGKSDGKDIVASSPYFRANPELREKLGLKAPKTVNNENYGTYIDIEPITGTTLGARKRLQLNVRLRKDPSHPLLANLTEEWVLIPLLWVEEGADLDEENAQMLRDKVFTPKSLITVGLITLMCLFVILFVGASAVYYFRSR